MSTGWNAECMDHPDASYLLDEDISGGGDYGARCLSELLRLQSQVLAALDAAHALDATRDSGMTEVDVIWSGTHLWPSRHGTWLRTHGGCRIELVNEYGQRVTPDLEPRAPHHRKTCTCEPGSYRT